MESARKNHNSSSLLRTARATPMLLDQSTLPSLSAGGQFLMSWQARSISPLVARTQLAQSRRLPNTRQVFKPSRGTAKASSYKQQKSLTPTKAQQTSGVLPTLYPGELDKRKLWLRRQLHKHYHVKLSLQTLRHLSEAQLCDLALQRRRNRLALAAAQQMLKWLRSRKVFRAVSEQKQRMHMSAFKIQLHWRRYVMKVKRPREETQKVVKSVQTIQRYYRGYLARERVRAIRLMAELDRMHKYYVGVKEAIMREKGLKILLFWRRYRLTKRIRKREEAARQPPEIPPAPSKWDFKPIINKDLGGKKPGTRLAAERPASIKTNPSWKQKALELEPTTPRTQKTKSKDEPPSPVLKRFPTFVQKSQKRGSTSSTEPSTPMSSGVEVRLKNDREKLLLGNLDKIDEVEM